MKIYSLNQRIIISAVLVLVVFITLTAAALNKAFSTSSENALKDTLTTQVYALIATAEVDIVDQQTQFVMPIDDLDRLFGLPNSGLTALVINPDQTIVWQSESTITSKTPKALALSSGQQNINKIKIDGLDYLQIAFGTSWIIGNQQVPLTFIINQDLSAFNTSLDQYSATLWSWLSAMALFLIISQVLILKWGLKPINTVVEELHLIEQGKQEHIKNTYPKEIEVLSRNINHLLTNEQAQKTRYRNALGDLAHSLKTPLAIIQSTNESRQNSTISEQITAMNSIVEYQLQKAATAGSNQLSQEIDLSKLIKRIIDSMNKVYTDKAINLTFTTSDSNLFKADEGDMMELFGNLIDNAFKWANSHISMNLSIDHQKLKFNISDDGIGFPDDLIDQLKVRGKRADETTPGHGIGLSIVNNIIDSYSGSITIKNNKDLNGASITIQL